MSSNPHSHCSQPSAGKRDVESAFVDGTLRVPNLRTPSVRPTDGPIPRREFLWQFGGGLGGIAAAHLLGQNGLLADTEPTTGVGADWNGGLHHRAKAKRVIQLFMNGGASQCDTFDYKSELEKRHGTRFDPGTRVESVTGSPGFVVMKSPFEFKQHGQCGRWVSSVFPNLAQCVDDLAFLMSMASKTNVHGPGSYMMNTGFVTPGFPCLGGWISYGLGSLSDDLPTFVVMPDPRGLPYNQQGNFSSGFLPVAHQGTIIKAAAATPIADLFPPPAAKFITSQSEAEGLSLLNRLNREHLSDWQGDTRLDARIASYELAAKMQVSAPEVLDISGETQATRKLYGLEETPTEEFGRRCLIARRMLERGVRFVQIWSGAGGASGNWDNHTNINTELPLIAAVTDKPVAGLLQDLKARGLLEDTLVVWSTEFGRQPFSQSTAGRDHNGGTFVSWLAGAGVKGGTAYGESDEWSWKSLQPTWCYDLHATILHLLGIDHTRLTFRHNGSNRRLTDVHGRVISQIL
ncbi:MAG: DUF1501 domain-containing protein [Planctomycetaceae bacterium]|nr:DUF1501 domain-containing protein [Planctomycetaceae bacterium]